MFRGTTPVNKFTSSVDLSDADVVYITYKQADKVIVERQKDSITFGEGFFTIKLTQEETLKFSERAVGIQIRARFPDGTAIASNIIKTSAEDVLKDGVI